MGSMKGQMLWQECVHTEWAEEDGHGVQTGVQHGRGGRGLDVVVDVCKSMKGGAGV